MVLKMSILNYIATVVAFFVFLQCKVHAETIESDAENAEPMDSISRAERALYPSWAHLAGEWTPVFLAHEDEHQEIVYERLETGIVKQAIDYFKSGKFHGLPKTRRSVEENINLVEELNSIYSKRDANEEEDFYYPSLLVVMEHENKWPSDKHAQDELIFGKLLYALSYWEEVNNQLRRIRHPGVRIRITAFVLGRDKDATPASLKKQSMFGIRLYDTLTNTLMYWQELRQRNSDFCEGAFNVVATMIDSTPVVGTGYGFSVPSPVCGSYQLDPKHKLERLTGLIVHDKQDFREIGHAVAEISHIMGRTKTGLGASVDASAFSEKDLRDIRNGLQEASCWKKPLETHPPGKPVEALLREDVLPH